MTDTRSYEDVSTDPPEAQGRPSDLVKDDLPDAVGGEHSERLDDQRLLEDIEEALKDVVDPELGINVVDLGLIYGLHLEDDESLTIDMTLTSAACPLTDVIEDQTQTALEGLVDRWVINWVWMPPWGMEMITDDGRDQLRALGFNV
ncbi:MAG: metal-sulfur cluster assembly factor [Propionibacteriaceae bacterium]